MCAGEVVAREGSIVDRYRPQTAEFSSRFYHTVRVPPLAVEDFHWMVHDVPDGAVDVPAIAINEQDNYTVARTIRAEVRQKRVFLPSPGALLMMMERYSGEGNRSYAALVGMDFERGAVASTYSHDAHNLTVLGTDACDMWKAAEAVIQAGGGIAVAVQGSIAAVLPLPVAGLMSEASLAHVARKARALRQALAQWGYRHQNPFMNFSTLGLLVSPEIRLSDQGLVNVRTRQWWPCALYRHG
jgi:adenine deaminase